MNPFPTLGFLKSKWINFNPSLELMACLSLGIEHHKSSVVLNFQIKCHKKTLIFSLAHAFYALLFRCHTPLFGRWG